MFNQPVPISSIRPFGGHDPFRLPNKAYLLGVGSEDISRIAPVQLGLINSIQARANGSRNGSIGFEIVNSGAELLREQVAAARLELEGASDYRILRVLLSLHDHVQLSQNLVGILSERDARLYEPVVGFYALRTKFEGGQKMVYLDGQEHWRRLGGSNALIRTHLRNLTFGLVIQVSSFLHHLDKSLNSKIKRLARLLGLDIKKSLEKLYSQSPAIDKNAKGLKFIGLPGESSVENHSHRFFAYRNLDGMHRVEFSNGKVRHIVESPETGRLYGLVEEHLGPFNKWGSGFSSADLEVMTSYICHGRGR